MISEGGVDRSRLKIWTNRFQMEIWGFRLLGTFCRPRLVIGMNVFVTNLLSKKLLGTWWHLSAKILHINNALKTDSFTRNKIS